MPNAQCLLSSKNLRETSCPSWFKEVSAAEFFNTNMEDRVHVSEGFHHPRLVQLADFPQPDSRPNLDRNRLLPLIQQLTPITV